MPLQRGEFPQKFATTKKVANQLERLQFPLFNFFLNSIIVHLQKQHTIHTVQTVHLVYDMNDRIWNGNISHLGLLFVCGVCV